MPALTTTYTWRCPLCPVAMTVEIPVTFTREHGHVEAHIDTTPVRAHMRQHEEDDR